MQKNWFRLLLYPFTLIFATIVTIRNLLFDWGILESTRYNLPIISIGNLTVGGTGKTPLTELLIRHLEKNKSIALLSRGYGRKTKGVIIASPTDDYNSIGDEPMQIKTKFKNLTIAVAERRRDGIQALLNLPNSPQVILLDDAFQHRYVNPGLSIVVMDYYRPIWRDLCLPAGNLREPKKGMNRANLVVVNKCPSELSEQEAFRIQNKLKIDNPEMLFFTSIHYGEPVPLIPQTNSFLYQLNESGKNLVAMAGIGNPEPFFNMAKKFEVPLTTLKFADHHDFTPSDLRKMEVLCNDNKKAGSLLLTTEKDAIRLSSANNLSNQFLQNIWYIPIELKFLFDAQTRFERKIDSYVAED
jgi:tetraacyldisaccharide 4'-kinase